MNTMTTDTTEKTQTQKPSTESKPDTKTGAGAGTASASRQTPFSARGRRARPPRGRRGRTRERSEFDQVTIEVRRVARVMAGGRRFSFSVTAVIGDRKGRVGVGVGKGADTALAVEKAARDARKHLVTISRTSAGSIPHAVTAKYESALLMMSPSAGRGIVAGSAMRTVLELAGITDVVGKILSRSKNKLTIARTTVIALSGLVERKQKQEKTETAPDESASE